MTAPPVPACGRFDDRLHRYAVRVYHEDTDASGLVYHATYLRWFERARSDILALLGIDQRQAMDDGSGFYVVSEMAIRYRAPARLGDALVIETTCFEARAASARMTQVAMLGDAPLCEADVRVGFIGADGRPRRQPEPWRQAFVSVVSDKERE